MNRNRNIPRREAGLDLPTRIDLEGTYNVRDLGGYANRHGCLVKRGVYYRADNLSNLTRIGKSGFSDLRISTVIDLRTEREVRSRPNPVAKSKEIAYHVVDLVGDSHEIISRGDTIVSRRSYQKAENGFFADPIGRLVGIYTTMLDHQGDSFRRTFSLLAEESAGPWLFHCVAGQDRTGLVAALLLSLAEVPRETVIHDYAATAHYNVHRYLDEKGERVWGMPIRDAADYGSQFCPPEAMAGTLDHIDTVYGGAKEYLRATGVSDGEIDSIRRELLE